MCEHPVYAERTPLIMSLTTASQTKMDRALRRTQEAERCGFTPAGAARYFLWLDTNALQDLR